MNITKLTLISGFAAFTVVLFGFSGCKEDNKPIDFSRPATVGDTTYVLTAGTFPTSVDHNVLVEEFTGASCANCPDGARILRGIESSNPGRINVLGLCPTSSLFCNPPAGYTHDFRNESAENIANQIYAGTVSSYPAGGIDRVPVGGHLAMERSLWTGEIERKLTPCKVSIGLNTSYNPGADKDTITVKVTYLDSTSVPGNLTVAIVEDSMYDYQEVGTAGFLPNQLFMNILRETVTPYNGIPLDLSTPLKEAGRMFQKVFVYTPKTLPAPNPAINPVHCRVIAFVGNPGIGGDYTIVQSAQTPLRH